MKKTLGELAALVEGELRGPADLMIRGLAPVDQATPEDITFIAHPRFARLGEASQAGAVIVSPQWAALDKPLIVVDHPYLAYARVAALFARARPRWPGISDQAYLGAKVHLGRDVAVGPLVFVGDGVRLGDRVTLMPGCYLGPETVIFTMGKEGNLVSENGRVTAHVPTREVDVEDATGAGDSFWAGFLTALLDDNTVERSVLFAREIVAKKLTTKGPRPSEIDRREIYARLDENGGDTEAPRERRG